MLDRMEWKMKALKSMFVLGIMLVTVCSCGNDGNPVETGGEDIEIIGMWQGEWSGDDFTLSILNSSMSWNFSQMDNLESQILEYDNDANTCIYRWTSHPVYTDKYQKMGWLSEPASTVDIRTYSEWNTLEEAMNDSVYKYDPITLTKI